MVQQLRVVDLAHTMGITPTELIFKLRSIGVNVSSEEATLDLSTVRSIITGETLQKRPREVIVRTDSSPEDEGTSARDRVARRRRRVIKTERRIEEVAGRSREEGEGAEDAVSEAAAVAEAAEEEAAEPTVEATSVPEVEAPDEPEPDAPPRAEAELETEAEAEAEAEPPEVAEADAEAVEAPVEEPQAEEATAEEEETPAAEAAAPAASPEAVTTEPAPTEAEAVDATPQEAAAKPAETEGEPKVEAEAEAPSEPQAEAVESPASEAEPTSAPETVEAVEEDDEVLEGEKKPTFEVSEEELSSPHRPDQQRPQRVRAKRARTPLERNLRELSPDEIRQRLQAQKQADKQRKEKPAAGAGAGAGAGASRATSRKAKAAADAREIRDLLNKFEEQKLKTQQETTTRPKPGPGAGRPGAGPSRSKKGRKRRPARENGPPIPRPRQTIQFRDSVKPEGPIILSEMVTARELAEKLNIMVKDLIAHLIRSGVMVTANQVLPHELAEQVCEELGVEAMVATAEELIDYEREESAEPIGETTPRSPVVTVMGHVDHGKTSLLDAIRATRVAEQEAGGITQHIGASVIDVDEARRVVFIDTPGHEAFTQMRARGAQVTDLVVLVVAADDGVMPQTLEAINHARASNVGLMIALNKVDKANANPDRVKQQLAERDVLVEDWGGDVPCVPVSAKQHQGIDELLDMILLVAEMRELKAVAEGPARGIVLEAQKERGRGSVATVLIQHGTLHTGAPFFCGSTWGRVRAMTNDRGERVTEARPSDPVEIMGFNDVPAAGDLLQVVESEEKAIEVASFRHQREKEEALGSSRKVSLENLFDRMAADDVKQLNLVIKADVQGSVEVLAGTLESLSTDKVKIDVLHSSVGAINTNDVMLATASEAIIIGFNVRPERTARELAEESNVDIRLYTVIYDLVDDIKKAMVGLLEPVYREAHLGQAEVRDVFRVPKVGAVAGCHVTEGIVRRNARVRLLRDNVVVYEGGISSLKRFKDDASEVRQGFDCGIGLERFNDIKIGDVIEAHEVVEVAPTL
jgi:translation initiation factor IF-2